jgi:hypothetical protein
MTLHLLPSICPCYFRHNTGSNYKYQVVNSSSLYLLSLSLLIIDCVTASPHHMAQKRQEEKEKRESKSTESKFGYMYSLNFVCNWQGGHVVSYRMSYQRVLQVETVLQIKMWNNQHRMNGLILQAHHLCMFNNNKDGEGGGGVWVGEGRGCEWGGKERYFLTF